MTFQKISKLKEMLSKPSVIFTVWLIIVVCAWASKYFHGSYNNFLIFRGVFFHAVDGLSLYGFYPGEYKDLNHYGPFFSIVIAPFALMPLWLSLLSWLMALAFTLFYAIKTLPLKQCGYTLLYWFCAHELLTALFYSQFNIVIAAILVLSFTFIKKEKDIWAALFIMLGTFVKLYGIVGLAFFLFSKHKTKLLLSCIGWGVVMFAAPMLFTSPEYIINQYGLWITDIIQKNNDNALALYQNVSLLGIIRKTTHNIYFSDLWILIPGCIIFIMPYLRIKQYAYLPFRLMILASALIFTVIFSSGSESCSYIIAFVGIALWYYCVPWRRTRWDIALMIFAFILTSMSPSDLFPKYLREEYIRPYALKALPCVIIWFKLTYELLTKNYKYDGERI
ncbi:MAG: glycosyltransferase family 87 protein [Bacteroidales bacterium]